MSKLGWVSLFAVLLVEHLTFSFLTIRLRPTDEQFALLFLAWVTLPAVTGAIASCNTRYYVAVAATNGLISGSIIDYLFLYENFFWDRRKITADSVVGIAIGYPLLAIVMATICGAFVHVVCKRMDSCKNTSRGSRTLLGAKKGLLYSVVCVLCTLPFLLYLQPRMSGRISQERKSMQQQRTRQAVSWYSASGVLFGSAVGAFVGAAYKQKP